MATDVPLHLDPSRAGPQEAQEGPAFLSSIHLPAAVSSDTAASACLSPFKELIHFLMHALIHLFTHFFIYSFIHSSMHSLTFLFIKQIHAITLNLFTSSLLNK